MKGWVDKTSQTHSYYLVAHAQGVYSKAEADDRTFNRYALQDTFDKATDMRVAIHYKHKFEYDLTQLFSLRSHKR